MKKLILSLLMMTSLTMFGQDTTSVKKENKPKTEHRKKGENKNDEHRKKGENRTGEHRNHQDKK
jgi:Ni/Co efflux regulator RcnB